MPKKIIPGVEDAIRLYMRANGLLEKDLAERLGVSQQAVNTALNNGFGVTLAKKWADTFGFNAAFLTSGEGQLTAMGDCPVQRENKDVPLLPVLAHAGHLQDYSEMVSEYNCERIVSPVKGVEMAIPVVGDSMAPEFPAGSIVYIQRIDELAYIEWGKSYIVDTVNGVVLKYLTPGENGKVRCLSANPDPRYAPFEVSMADILGIYKVVVCLSLK